MTVGRELEQSPEVVGHIQSFTAAIAHFAHRFPPATDPAWLAFSDDDMHYSVPWFDALLRLVEGAGHPATAPLALGGRDRGFRRDRLRARFEGENGLAPCTFVGA